MAKRIILKKLFAQVIFVLILIWVLISTTNSSQFHPDIEIALRQYLVGFHNLGGNCHVGFRPAVNNQRVRSVNELTVIEGEQGIILIGIGDNSSIASFNFRRRESSGQVLYRVGDEVGLRITENWIRRMRTAPNSREEILFGLGRDSAEEFAEITGQQPVITMFTHDNQQRELWYIVSVDGFPGMAEQRSQTTIHTGHIITTYSNPSRANRIFSIIFTVVPLLIIAIVIFYKIRKNRKNRQT